MSPSIDHLAVAATTLEGRDLDDFLGVTLPPGGRHARMGTHNRLLRLGVTLEALELEHPRATEIQRQLDALGLTERCSPGPGPRLTVHLRTPAGMRVLRSTEPAG